MTTRKRDIQAPRSGKLANDRNKLGDKAPTATNQGQRTPQSRGDRDTVVGSNNQTRSRRGGLGGGQH